MTDKERLEEIKLLVEELTYEYVHDDTFYGLFVDIDRESIDLLIEQAEIGVNADKDKQTLIKSNIELNARVQELENKYKLSEGDLYELVDRHKALKKQNKRYWEVIDKIKKTSDDYRAGHLLDIQDSFFVDEIIAIIKNLEGDLE